LALAGLSSAHFTLKWPPTAGFIDENEPKSPCGGATVNVNSSSPRVGVDQFPISIQSSHPQGEWLIRGTTDTKEPYNFITLAPVISTKGIGQFCLPSGHAPKDWAGKSGIIQVITTGEDGRLYQCGPVNFVSGSSTDTGTAGCRNNSGFSASWTTHQTLTNSSSASSGTSSASSTTASASSTSTQKSDASLKNKAGFLTGLGFFFA
ncbi:hypothetical protein K470DRAFT_206944, partial [Piedraia hortae CBS 480.64]